MRQIAIAAALGIVGMVLAALGVRFIAAGTTSNSDHWLVAGAVLPVFGVVLGAVLAHRLSDGADPWPIAERGRRIPFAFLGGLLGGLTWYVCYVMLAALWNNQDFWALTLSSRHRSGVATSLPSCMWCSGSWLALG